MKTFQKPLTPEEESRYLQEYKKGSPEAKDILIERNLRLVAHIVKKYQGAPEELDDLISIGTIGLIKAVQTFDANKANRLSTYAARCIDNPILSQKSFGIIILFIIEETDFLSSCCIYCKKFVCLPLSK